MMSRYRPWQRKGREDVARKDGKLNVKIKDVIHKFIPPKPDGPEPMREQTTMLDVYLPEVEIAEPERKFERKPIAGRLWSYNRVRKRLRR